MLQWVGKRPIEEVSYYPAQLVETYNAKTPPLQISRSMTLSPDRI